MSTFRYKEMQIHEHDAGHMIKIASTPIYGKNPDVNSIQFFYSGQLLTVILQIGIPQDTGGHLRTPF